MLIGSSSDDPPAVDPLGLQITLYRNGPRQPHLLAFRLIAAVTHMTYDR